LVFIFRKKYGLPLRRKIFFEIRRPKANTPHHTHPHNDMDLLKTKIYLDKLNREYARMSKDPENIARIDVDIVLSYIRELYDAVLSDTSTATVAVAPKPEPAPVRKPAAAARPVHEEIAVPIPPPPPPVVVAPAPAPVAVVVEPPAPVAPPPPPPVVEAPPPPVVVVPPPAPLPPAPTPTPPPTNTGQTYVSPEAEALFEEKQAKELSEKLSELPIADLRKGIALNDRLLLTRELFAGDGQAFDAALTALNSCANMAEAKDYLQQNCVIRFGWLDPKRIEPAKNFIKLVRRRYK